MSGEPSHTCPHCQMTSHHPADVTYSYCANCHHFCDDLVPGPCLDCHVGNHAWCIGAIANTVWANYCNCEHETHAR